GRRLSLDTAANLPAGVFRGATSEEVEMGYGIARATRIAYVGELGWELYVPTELAAGVYESVVTAGETLGVRHAGYHAMDSLRMEKGYRSWGHDIGCD